MNTKTVSTSVWVAVGALVAAFTLFSGEAAADHPELTVAYGASAQGLDLNKPAGARQFYLRIKHAADVVCSHGMRVDLAPPANPKACYEQALADAVRSVKQPLVTQVYLETHTAQEAAARGIEAPVQLAAQ